MNARDSEARSRRPVGYAALLERYGLRTPPSHHRSYVAGATRRTDATGEGVEETYPTVYWPGDSLGDQLEFALKYDGTNLVLLAAIFEVADPDELTRYVGGKRTGKYARRMWFLYELLTGKRLPLEDLKRVGYVDLLEPESYYTIPAGRRARRQCINDNLLGGAHFCPTIRRTDALRDHEAKGLAERCRRILADYPPELLTRALRYLYTKETRSSYEIERIRPSSTRTERFVALLQMAEREDFCSRDRLVELQNRIVDPRFRDADYRTTQNYVGESVSWQHERVHYACPRPEDVPDLMDELISAHACMEQGDLSPVVHAAIVAYALVFIHPFEDGNGRIHRFLIHNVLARRKFTPSGLVFPVSASMLRDARGYDASLEAFSKALMPLVDYQLDAEGRMTVANDTALWYRYIDMTAQAEALFGFIEQTIETDLEDELTFLASYDETKTAIQEIVDIPDRDIDLFIRFCLQNDGRLSALEKSRHFALLTAREIEDLERVVQAAYGMS